MGNVVDNVANAAVNVATSVVPIVISSSQKMRCWNCGQTAEYPLKGDKNYYIRFYKDLLHDPKRCPRCSKSSYALSAYDAGGIRKLRKSIEDKSGESISGGLYCSPGGKKCRF